jgi:hypothetical protein
MTTPMNRYENVLVLLLRLDGIFVLYCVVLWLTGHVQGHAAYSGRAGYE